MNTSTIVIENTHIEHQEEKENTSIVEKNNNVIISNKTIRFRVNYAKVEDSNNDYNSSTDYLGDYSKINGISLYTKESSKDRHLKESGLLNIPDVYRSEVIDSYTKGDLLLGVYTKEWLYALHLNRVYDYLPKEYTGDYRLYISVLYHGWFSETVFNGAIDRIVLQMRRLLRGLNEYDWISTQYAFRHAVRGHVVLIWLVKEESECIDTRMVDRYTSIVQMESSIAGCSVMSKRITHQEYSMLKDIKSKSKNRIKLYIERVAGLPYSIKQKYNIKSYRILRKV